MSDQISPDTSGVLRSAWHRKHKLRGIAEVFATSWRYSVTSATPCGVQLMPYVASSQTFFSATSSVDENFKKWKKH